MRRVLITGTAGFIGFHLARLLLAEGFRVHGYDGMTDYYDVTIKQRRHQMLLQNERFACTEGMLEDEHRLWSVAEGFAPDVIVHLAAQAGVRYSLENPRAYLDSNVIGTFNVMEAARKLKVPHLLMASTSSEDTTFPSIKPPLILRVESLVNSNSTLAIGLISERASATAVGSIRKSSSKGNPSSARASRA